MDVSIILVSYNTKELTKNCIKSIYEKTKNINFDIWVFDNASSDNSAEMTIVGKVYQQVDSNGNISIPGSTEWSNRFYPG